MAEGEGSSNTGVVAIVVIFLIVVIAAVFAWRGGMFGGSGKKTEIDVNVSAPSAPATK
jgi:ABC-type cobalt transport system substrate-binding protein